VQTASRTPPLQWPSPGAARPDPRTLGPDIANSIQAAKERLRKSDGSN
jgi:hypothetical protein